MDLHVFAEGTRVRVALVTTANFAVIGLVTGVDVAVFLAIRTVGKAAIAALELALEWFLP